jgi:hypothetical protein
MNLLLLGWSPSGTIDGNRAEALFGELLQELPFLDSTALKVWRAPSGRLVAMCASHQPAQVGGITYAHFEAHRFAMYSGRPFVWTDEFEADGRRALDPRFYLRPPEAWSDTLDGRCVVVRYDDATPTLDLYTDPLGACHIYAASDRKARWFSNNAELLRHIVGSRTIDPLVLASLVGCGWSLGGHPIWQDVRRLRRGTVYRFQPEAETHRERLSTSVIGSFFAREFVAEAAARTLVGAVRGLALWPGRPSSVTLTGGRDSRLVFAAALQAGIEFEARIIVGKSDRETPDVQTARSVCEAAGKALALAYSREVATVEDAVRALRLCAPGTYTLDLAWNALNRPSGSGLPDDDMDEPLALVHTGAGGEVARLYYGSGDSKPAVAERNLYRRITPVWPSPPISKDGEQLIKEYLGGWVDDQLGAGVSPADLPDLFYLLERMSNWVGGGNGFNEYMMDVSVPLWTPRLLPQEFGLPATERARELFHFHVLNALSPELARRPFAGSNPSWPTFGRTRPARGRRVRTFAGRAGREMRRRYEYRVHRAPGGRGVSGLAQAAELTSQRMPERSHSIWQVVDRKRALALLTRAPAALDARSQRAMWRLATVILVCLE